MKQNTQQHGYVLLITVVIVGAISSAIASALLLLGTGATRTSGALAQSQSAKSYANSCAEEAIYQLGLDVSYAAGEELIFDEGVCSIDVISGTGDTDRTVQVTGRVINRENDSTTSEVDDVVRKVEFTIDNLGPPVVIGNWEEVGDF